MDESEAKKPDNCPKCGKPLEYVDEYGYSQWKFNPKTGAYENVSPYGGSSEYQCSHCNHDVDHMFPEGPGNK